MFSGRKKFFILISALFISQIFLLASPASAAGAKLFISPSSGSFNVGKTFTVKVSVDSGGGLGINAAEGNLTFDPDYLTVSRVSNTDTIFKLWVTDPTFSNSNGTISFGGGLPGAYKGSAGSIFSVVFNAKKVGDTSVKFVSGAVLAPDGKGTNILNSYGSANFTITEAVKEEPKEPKKKKKSEPTGIVPPRPEVNSKTHKNQETWYSNNSPEFLWKLIADLIGVSYGLDNEPEGDPGPVPDGLVETAKFENSEDGEWYFHLKYQNKAGWGPIAHRKVLIDATRPKINSVKINNFGDITEPRPTLFMDIKDVTSGINNYKISVDNNDNNLSVDSIKNGKYKFDVLSPGEKEIKVVVSDKAGNTSSTTFAYFVQALKSPIITDIPKVIKRNEELIIRGTSFYPEATVNIYLGIEGKEDYETFSVVTDIDGNWSYFHNKTLDKGNYEVWTKLIDSRGAQSYSTSKHILTVISPTLMERFGWYIVSFLMLLLISLILLIVYMKNKCFEEKKRIARETDEAKLRLTEIFTALREEVDELMELADKKPGLSESERRVKEKLQEALDISEEFIGKEIEDVKKEIDFKDKNLKK